MDYRKTAKGLWNLMRPLEWSKSLGNMLIGALVASYFLYGAAFNSLSLDWILFAIGFIGVALLWGALYALNDYMDREADAKHAVKKERPLASGAVPAHVGLEFLISLLVSSFVIGFYIFIRTDSVLYLICLIGMMVNQFLYTLKPFEFKKRAVVDIISGSMVNPFFRFYAGWVLVLPAFNAPLDILAFVVMIQLGGYAIYRLSAIAHEKELGYKSSGVVFGEKVVKAVACLAMLIAGLGYFHAVLFATLPFGFIALALLSVLAAPLYLKSITNPQGMDLKAMHKLVYWHYLLFIAGFVVLFAL